jgi:hypothetical protein
VNEDVSLFANPILFPEFEGNAKTTSVMRSAFAG